ncbi:uncharacterized protein BO97DRAFT_346074 [Aspergillus homomorphus CBS 101889]|uniref:Xylanolytic transcriptional activator regulatory domain-containing protein n=1 Tax=Aspergillus homomorphus (strain CBS 101889) TaxID=1450537 RepID=A0A395HVK3_ASPHC|nr:hypothetical protein BO97DRAFT_346074 [Aspergillus homomorphus CBS 101889]RAL11847.1 hypothetical protein BO97DRAFT_346074 [Aspergillus homomorphus CBS 101889]
MPGAAQDIQSLHGTHPIPPAPASPLPNTTTANNFLTDSIADPLLLDPVQDFTDFVDTMGLSSDWNMFAIPHIENSQQLTPLTIDESSLPSLEATSLEIQRQGRQLSRAHEQPTISPSPRETDDSFGVDEEEPTAYINFGHPLHQCNVTQSQYAALLQNIEQFHAVIPDFVLPSRHALTRFISGYFDGFHNHLPFIHLPTFCLRECAPEFILAIAAVGAQYRFESHIGLSLFDAAKAVSMEQARRRTQRYSEEVVGLRVAKQMDSRPPYSLSEKGKWSRLQTVRALLLLIVFATWDDDPELLREAIGFQTVLAGCLRESTFNEHIDIASVEDWHEWVRMEGDRRIKLVVFCYLTLQAIIYNIPPAILNDEIHLRLPCSSIQWNAKSAGEWSQARRSSGDCQPLFQDALATLLMKCQSPASQTYFASPLGNFVLIHALLQRLFMIQQLAAAADPACVDSLRGQLECALHRWKLGWQRAPESSLDPHNPSGPIPFTSTGFLALAYVRLVCDLGPHRALNTRDPTRIAAALAQLPPVDRSPRLIPALLHSAHAFSIPVKLGVDFVAKSQHFFWSVQQCVCNLECAVFLSRWLHQIGQSKDSYPLSESEQRLLLWTSRIVAEAPVHPYQGQVAARLTNPGTELDTFQLGLRVIQIWAQIFKGNTSWRLVNILGESLEMLALMMQNGSLWTHASGIASGDFTQGRGS